MSQTIKTPNWWLKLAKFLLVATVCVVFFCLFSTWAINAESIGRYNFGSAIDFAFYSVFSFYASLALIIFAVIGVIVGLLIKYTVRLYMIMLAVSLIPIIYLGFIR